MTAGGGTYLLEDARSRCRRATSSTWRRTARSPSSPATSRAEYLLYKDVWRDGF